MSRKMTRDITLANVIGDGCLDGAIDFDILSLSVSLKFNGYGDYCSLKGHGHPVLIENRNGTPYVVIWADINSEEPTHVISLAGALESARIHPTNCECDDCQAASEVAAQDRAALNEAQRPWKEGSNG